MPQCLWHHLKTVWLKQKRKEDEEWKQRGRRLLVVWTEEKGKKRDEREESFGFPPPILQLCVFAGLGEKTGFIVSTQNVVFLTLPHTGWNTAQFSG